MTALPTTKKVVFAMASVVLGLLAIFLISEVVLRLAFGKIERITGATEWETSEWEGLTYLWDQYHPRLGWTNVPGYRSDDRVPFRVTINVQGLRGTVEYGPTPPAGVRRVALFGDSCTFGEEVDDDQTVAAYLERHLAGVEVLNFGVHGYGLGQMALRLEDEGFTFNPDHVVIVLLLPSDIGRDPAPRFSHNKPVFNVVDSQLQITNIPVPIASRQPWVYRHVYTAAWLCGRPKQWPAPGILPDQLKVTKAIVERIKSACRARGVPFTLVNIVVADTLDNMQTSSVERATVDHIRQVLGEQDADVLDLTTFLRRAYDQEGRHLVAERGHWSPRGNCLIAEQVARHLAGKHAGWQLSRDPTLCVTER